MNAPPQASSTVTVLRFTALVSAVFAFALVVWGGIVRINGAGMTCPDWPRCRGVWFPALNDSVVYEWTHRYGAALLTLLIVATFIAAWRARREQPAAWRASWFCLGLLAAQIVVGALTIAYANNPPSVAAHLGLGILTFVSLLMVWYLARPAGSAAAPAGEKASVMRTVFARLAVSAAILTFFAILAAGYMSASNAGLACTQFPLCYGWGPPQTIAEQIHMGHRMAAYLAFGLIVIAALMALREQPGRPEVKRLATLALVLGTLQVALGVATVVSGLEPILRSVHQANGALTFASLVVLAYAAYTT
jgi:heme A synthase